MSTGIESTMEEKSWQQEEGKLLHFIVNKEAGKLEHLFQFPFLLSIQSANYNVLEEKYINLYSCSQTCSEIFQHEPPLLIFTLIPKL